MRFTDGEARDVEDGKRFRPVPRDHKEKPVREEKVVRPSSMSEIDHKRLINDEKSRVVVEKSRRDRISEENGTQKVFVLELKEKTWDALMEYCKRLRKQGKVIEFKLDYSKDQLIRAIVKVLFPVNG